MTRLLAIDTATEVCAVGVLAGDGRVVTRAETVGRGHAEVLMAMIAAAMGEAALSFADLDRIAVTVGPGSFTGVRVGIAAVRALALVTGAEAVGISTLAVHAEAARPLASAASVLAVLPAGRGEVYGAGFDGDGRERATAAAGSPQHFAARVAKDTVLAGSGADLVLAALPMTPRVRVAHRAAVPDMAAFMRLAARAPGSAAPPRPLYLRPPDARPQAAAAVVRR